MAARLATPSQGAGAGGDASPDAVRELIVIPEIPDSIQLQHAIQQVTSAVVEVNGGSSGDSSPSAEAQHTYITVAMQGAWADGVTTQQVKPEEQSDQESEGSNGVNYHVQYVTEPQEIYAQGHQTHMDSLRSYPVYGVTTVGAVGAVGAEGAGGGAAAEGTSADAGWGGATAEYTTYGVVVAGDEAETASSPATPAAAPPPQAPRMPPATVQWLLDNYETAEGVSLPRSTLYTHYLRHCTSHRLDPVNAASFGKLIRSVFIGLRTRRLGTRGNSKYHYYGIRAKGNVNSSSCHDDDKTDVADQQEEHTRSPSRSCSPPPAVGLAGAAGVGVVAHRQYLGSVIAPDPPALVVHDLPDDIPPAALVALNNHHREHGVEFLEAVAALDITAVERSRRSFWRRPPPELCRRVLFKLAARKDVAAWLNAAELELYQRAVELLLPDVLRPIPPQLTQAIRNFAKSLEGALGSGGAGAPGAAARAQAAAAAALAAALRRYTSLNHLAQAARAVLTNHHQIHQMLSDLNRVDFRVVREQAAWACACSTRDTAHRLEADFKATLGRGATLEQWAAWLETCVRGALAPHEHRADYTARARRLLLDWSFYSSLVIRELTLRSAASFGSFHLIRLLYDEYVSYLIERQVAAHRRHPPIAVMHTHAHTHMEDEEDITEDAEAGRAEAEPEDDDEQEQEWEWDDDDEEDDEPVECKKPKLPE